MYASKFRNYSSINVLKIAIWFDSGLQNSRYNSTAFRSYLRSLVGNNVRACVCNLHVATPDSRTGSLPTCRPKISIELLLVSLLL